MSRSLKEKEKRREALERLQRDKNKNGLSRLDEHDFEVPDVFDLVDETEYTSIVESR